MKYRADIDGLRAIAVLPVVFFHGGFDLFSGGFVGVDIFFVISGFLITSIILNDLEKGQFSIQNFYERRIRRIFPALYTVCFATLILSSILFLPSELESFGKSLVSTLLFVSNILFWSETGYFDASADLKPLLHTWSLAVEEQFYVFFPILLIIISRFLKSKYVPVLLTVAILSFLISIWGSEHKPSATFYWAPTRAWELLLGAVLALNCLPSLKHKWQAEMLSLTGIGLIGYSVFFFGYDTIFPGFHALYPCLGAAFLIYSGQHWGGAVSRFMSFQPIVFIGLCSYSFYLWHWPVFVFAKYLSIEPLNSLQSISLIVLSFVLSVLSWKYIEAPFRKKVFLKGRGRIFLISFLVSLPLFLSAVTLVFLNGWPQRFADIEILSSYKKSTVDENCVDIKLDEFQEKKCLFGHKKGKNPHFLVWGDSHASAMVSGIGEAAKKYSKSGYLASFSGCPPLLDIAQPRDEKPMRCRNINDSILSSIQSGDIIFLVARWTYYARKSLLNKEGPVWLNNGQSHEISEIENYRVLGKALDQTIKSIKSKGATPIVVGTLPEFSKSVPEAYFLFKKQVVVSRFMFDQNRRKTHELLNKISEENNVIYIDPSTEFCDDNKCIGNEGKEIYFFDNDHISAKGALKIAPMFYDAF